jgi:hypothetical protein
MKRQRWARIPAASLELMIRPGLRHPLQVPERQPVGGPDLVSSPRSCRCASSSALVRTPPSTAAQIVAADELRVLGPPLDVVLVEEGARLAVKLRLASD